METMIPRKPPVLFFDEAIKPENCQYTAASSRDHRKRMLLFPLLLALISGSGFPQSPALLKDILPPMTSPRPSNPMTCKNQAILNGYLYFVADDYPHGPELFRTRGKGTTELVKDIYTGWRGSNPYGFCVAGNTLYFFASDGNNFGIWQSDGTRAGTKFAPFNQVLTANIPSSLFALGNTLLFSYDDNVHGSELWKTDGTVAGTVMVKDINPGSAWGSPSNLAAGLGGIVLFTADDGIHGRELWRSDGTTAGTCLVKDINPTGDSGIASLESEIHIAGSLAFFHADDGTHGFELWCSDGTTFGTIMVKDLFPGANNSYPNRFTTLGAFVYFSATDGAKGSYDIELWRSDGTAPGTTLVKDICPGANGSDPVYISAVGPHLFFFANDGIHGLEPWKSDGTAGGTAMIKDVQPGPGASASFGLNLKFTSLNNLVFFQADDGVHGMELWAYDNNTSGTTLVKDISPGGPSSYPKYLVRIGNQIAFSADDGVAGTELWFSDATPAGTLLEEINIAQGMETSSAPRGLIDLYGTLLFTAADQPYWRKIWRSSGTEAGTTMVKDLNPASGYFSGGFLSSTILGNLELFFADDGIHGEELWATDGTAGHTCLIKDLNTGKTSTLPTMMDILGDHLVFSASLGNFTGLFSSDGTPAGTIRYTTIGNIKPDLLLATENQIYFQAANGDYIELWCTDGTQGGTRIIKQLPCMKIPPFNETILIKGAIRQGNATFFVHTTVTDGRELWISDDTSQGTAMVRDIVPGQGSSNVANLVAFKNLALFTADDGIHGREPWISDGTASGTIMIKDICPGPSSSIPSSPVPTFFIEFVAFDPLGDMMVFWADDGVHGREPWITDGTPTGTILLKDINSGSGSSFSGNTYDMHRFYRIGSHYVFIADDGIHGTELWFTDGTAAGTQIVKDISLGPVGSFIYEGNIPNDRNCIYLGSDRLLFTVGVSTSEFANLWVTDGTPGGTKMISDLVLPSRDMAQICISGGKVFFAAADLYYDNGWWIEGIYGNEPWVWFPGATAQAFGRGRSSADHPPILGATDPRLGATMTVSLEGAPASTGAVALLSVPSSPLHLGNGCYVYLDLLQVFFAAALVPDSRGKAGFQLPVPADPGLTGLRLAAQAFVLPTQTPPLGVDFTNGVYLTLGR